MIILILSGQEHSDVKTALSRAKTMYADLDFAKFNASVNDIRSITNTFLMVRVMDF